MTTKTDLHRLVDALPQSLVDPAVRILEALQDAADPVLLALRNAPLDDEPTTPEDKESIREGREAWARGDVVSQEDVMLELGL